MRDRTDGEKKENKNEEFPLIPYLKLDLGRGEGVAVCVCFAREERVSVRERGKES